MAYKKKIIIIGKTGTGKSSLANTLLGRESFPTGSCANAVTEECRGSENGNLLIIDTPGLCSAGDNVANRALRIQSALDRCEHPHAFLIVFRLGRVTNEDELIFDFLEVVFGPGYLQHTIVVFTNVPQDMEDIDFRAYCNANEFLKRLIKTYGNRVARIDNIERYDKTEHIARLFSFVDSVSCKGSRTFQLRNRRLYCKILQKAAHLGADRSLHGQIQNILKELNRALKWQKWQNYGLSAIGLLLLGLSLNFKKPQINKMEAVPSPISPPPTSDMFPPFSSSARPPPSSLHLPTNPHIKGGRKDPVTLLEKLMQFSTHIAFDNLGEVSQTTGHGILNAELRQAERLKTLLPYIAVLTAKQLYTIKHTPK